MAKKINENHLEKAIELLSIDGHSQFVDCFTNFIDLHLSFFCNNPDERQHKLFQYAKDNKEFNQNFTKALELFADASENYHDALGDMFMNRISHGEKGQFFTPDSISELMSMLTIRESSYQTVYDPTCGSGRLLLKALGIARSKNSDLEIHANDISLLCSKMMLLNLLINSATGVVTCGNALLNDTENFVFYKIDRVKHIEYGKILSTYWQYTKDTVEAVNKQRNEWWWTIARAGWLEYKFDTFKSEKNVATTASPAPLTDDVSFQKDENGQFRLF